MDSAKKAIAAFDRVPVPDAYKPGTVNMHVGESNPAVAESGNFLHRERDDSLTFSMPKGGGVTPNAAEMMLDAGRVRRGEVVSMAEAARLRIEEDKRR